MAVLCVSSTLRPPRIKAEDRPWRVCGNCANIVRIMNCYLIQDGDPKRLRGVDDPCNFTPSRFQMATGKRAKRGGKVGRGHVEDPF